MSSSYGTLEPNVHFRPDDWAERIERALRDGKKDLVVSALVSLNNAQRQALRKPYATKYGKELTEALDKKFSGDAEILIKALMYTPLEYDLHQLKHAMKGLGTDENTLVEIICSRTPDQLHWVREQWLKETGKSLESVVTSETSGEFGKVLVSLVAGSRDHTRHVDADKAHDDAVRLYADGKAKLASKDGGLSNFHNILTTNNLYQLRQVFSEFERLSGASIETAIEKEFSKELRASYLAIARCTLNKQRYFAGQLHNSMKGLGTRENDLVRVLVTRSEVDLRLVADEYAKTYGKSLSDEVKSETSGVFQQGLLAIVAGNDGGQKQPF